MGRHLGKRSCKTVHKTEPTDLPFHRFVKDFGRWGLRLPLRHKLKHRSLLAKKTWRSFEKGKKGRTDIVAGVDEWQGGVVVCGCVGGVVVADIINFAGDIIFAGFCADGIFARVGRDD